MPRGARYPRPDYAGAPALDPQHADAYYNRANACEDKGDLDRAIALDPQDVDG